MKRVKRYKYTTVREKGKGKRKGIKMVKMEKSSINKKLKGDRRVKKGNRVARWRLKVEGKKVKDER